jgi:hypothetical protein
LEPNRTLVLHSTYGMFSGLSFDPSSGPVPRACVDGSWGFYLRATPSGGTRLVAHSRSRNAPRPAARPLDLLLIEPVHFLMQTRQFHNLRKRVNAEPRDRHRFTAATLPNGCNIHVHWAPAARWAQAMPP